MCTDVKKKRISCFGIEFTSKTDLFVSQLATIRGHYRTMRDDDQSAQDGFIMGFSNPLTESTVGAADSTDGRVTVIGYRPLREDAGHGSKGNMLLPFSFEGTGGCREPVGVLSEVNFINSLFFLLYHHINVRILRSKLDVTDAYARKDNLDPEKWRRLEFRPQCLFGRFTPKNKINHFIQVSMSLAQGTNWGTLSKSNWNLEVLVFEESEPNCL